MSGSSVSKDYYHEFYQNNKLWINCHLFITIIIFPTEIILFGIFSKRLFEAMQHNNNKTSKFFSVLVIFFVVLLVIQFMYILKDILDSKIIPEFETFTRSKLMHQILQEPRDDQNVHIGEVIHNISRLPSTMHHNYENMLKFTIPFVGGCCFFTGYVFYLQWRLGIICLVFFILFFICMISWFFHITGHSISRIQNENDLMDQYEDILLNQENIHLANQSTEELDKIENINSKFQHVKSDEITSINTFKIVSIIVVSLFLMTLFLYCYFLHSKYPFLIPISKFVAFITILVLMTRTTVGLLSQSSKMIYHYGSGYNLDHFHSQFITNHHDHHTTTFTPVHYDIRVHDLSFSYDHTKPPILHHINLNIPFRTSCLITGVIGSGKSTMALILIGMKNFDYTGDYYIGDMNVRECNPRQLRYLITYMNQKNILFNRRIIDNIWYGQQIPPDAEQQLTDLECPQNLMNRLYEHAGKYGSNLSGGQKRLLFLLRCFFSKCPIVILDEPTANIDPTTIDIVITLILKMQKRKTVICISHNDIMYPFFDLIFRIQDGTLIPVQRKKNNQMLNNASP